MKNVLTIGIFLLTLTIATAQPGVQYSRVKVILGEKTIIDLAKAGIDVTHGVYGKNQYYINDFSSDEIKMLQNQGFSYEIVIPDVKQHYLSQTTVASPEDDCSTASIDYPTPVNYNLGTMGGFFKYQEILDHLDSMAAKYPHLINTRQPISTTNLTHEGRQIYWLRISDNPTQDENEPEAIYTAVHHAREPGSVAQLLFFMWYMLENYATDPEIQYLVDNTELYFIPVVNPDGYVYNEVNDPNGGGLWRKNRRNNGGGSYGVDLNRNYGYQWGFDNSGSSPNIHSSTYRGPSAFSEPETQNVRDFCAAHQFQIALNYHTYGNLLIYPWGYSDSHTVDSTTFVNFARLMTEENDYVAGTGTETVGYVVNGDTDDWMYGDTVMKGKIISMTPEVGPGIYGFWPPATEIIPHGKENILQNISVPRFLLNYGQVKDQSDVVLSAVSGTIPFEVKRLGFQNGPLTVSLQPISNNIFTVGASKTFTLNQFESAFDSISYQLTNLQNNTEVVFLLTLDNGITVYEDTIRKQFGQNISVFQDPAMAISNWSNTGSNNWVVASDQYYSAPSSFTESPGSDYAANAFAQMTLATPIDLTNATTSVKLRFWAKWAIEANYDYTQVGVYSNITSYTPLCGLYTKSGSSFQDFDKPVFDGIQSSWVQEEMDLSPFIGQQIYVQFSFYSDGFIEDEGFYFDDVEIIKYDSLSVNTVKLTADDFNITTQPNPAQDFTKVVFEKPIAEDATLLLFNNVGQAIGTYSIPLNSQTFEINTATLSAGLYFYRIKMKDKISSSKKLVVVR